jgi:hypothetical protein
MKKENAAKKLFILFAFLYVTMFLANFAQGTTKTVVAIGGGSGVHQMKSPYAYSYNSARSYRGQRLQQNNIKVYDRKVKVPYYFQ